MTSIAINLTEQQLATIVGSLQSSIRRADEKAIAALSKGFADAKIEEAFYIDIKARCEETIAAINAAVATEPDEDDEDTCRDCGEDHGFCQCEEDNH